MLHKRTFLCCVSAWSAGRTIARSSSSNMPFTRKLSNSAAAWTTTLARGGAGSSTDLPLHFVGGSTRLMTSTTTETKDKSPPSEESDELQDKMSKAAQNAMGIFGSNLKPSSFYGVPYLDTSESTEFRVLFVLGGPGAGKGTQSDLLLQNYPCVHLSAGELLRKETTKESSPHKDLISDCLVSGKIVPVEISLSLLENAMKEAQGKSLVFLIDGFPRNFDNLQGWADCMSSVANVFGTLMYQCPLEELERRILSRAQEGSGRSDDNLQSARKRFVTFEKETVPIVDTLRIIQEEQCQKDNASLQVKDIRGDQSLEDVWQDTQAVMNSFIQHDVLTAAQQLIRAIETQDGDLYQQVCADEWFEHDETEPLDVMKSQEGKVGSKLEISNVELDFMSGTKVAVMYDRVLLEEEEEVTIREKRIWSHESSKGWQNIHFLRTPKEE